jgi:hypothetical protein
MFDKDSCLIWEQYKCLVLESKQSIINLGYPKILVDLIYEKFRKNSFIVANWFKQYQTGIYKSPVDDQNWWISVFSKSIFSSKYEKDVYSLIKLYNATNSEENYLKEREDQEDPVPDDYKWQLDVAQKRVYYKNKIKEKLFDMAFFHSSLIKKIAEGGIKNIKEYSKLTYRDALEKYNRKNVFEDRTPLKVYENGYKWIDVGPKCELVGSLMRNCGSSGVMSTDPNRTIITLFDSNNAPHVLVTYSPNQKRISGAEGQAGSNVKEKYYDYILDLEKHLDANIDYLKEKQKLLALKAMLKNHYRDISIIHENSFGSGFYLVTMNDGKEFYTNFNTFVSKENIEGDEDKIISTLIKVFNTAHVGGPYVEFITRYDFLKMYNIPEFEYKM